MTTQFEMVARPCRAEFADIIQTRRTGNHSNATERSKRKKDKAERHAQQLFNEELNRKNKAAKAQLAFRKKPKATKPTKKKRKAKRSKVKLSPFFKTLKTIGFSTYTIYLDSALWISIRLRVFRDKGRLCIKCREPATQIHHSRYDIETMRGTTLEHLHPVCQKCHGAAEIENGKKRGLKMANEHLGIS